MTRPAPVAAGQSGAAAPMAPDLAWPQIWPPFWIELKAAMHGFSEEFDAFQAEITQKFATT
jgi:hypothetical protein